MMMIMMLSQMIVTAMVVMTTTTTTRVNACATFGERSIHHLRRSLPQSSTFPSCRTREQRQFVAFIRPSLVHATNRYHHRRHHLNLQPQQPQVSSRDNSDTAAATKPSLSPPGPMPKPLLLDFLSPLLYKVERFVVSRMILPTTVPTNTTTTTASPLLVVAHHNHNNHTNDDDDDDTVFDHSLWNAVLQRHVQPYPPETIGSIPNVTVVDYDGVARDPDFARYLQHLNHHAPVLTISKKENQPGALLLRLDLSPTEELAFWINAYNALCISMIVQARKQQQQQQQQQSPPITSINDVSKNQPQPVWDQVAGSIGGVPLTLNDIEHGHLRRLFPKEPRIHACIVCASASCPNLRREAFVGNLVSQQMDEQMTDWMSHHPYKGLYWDPINHRVYLSRIFLWFASDFERNLVPDSSSSSSLLSWLSRYVTNPEVAQALNGSTTKNGGRPVSIRYFDYDWTLNQKTHATPQ